MDETEPRMMTTQAPWPDALGALVADFRYKPGWRAYLQDVPVDDEGVGGLRLFIISDTEDSIREGQRIRVRHEFIVPAATYRRSSWLVWLWERVLDVERHEAGEFFRILEERVFAPHHGNGENPYVTWLIGSDEAAAKIAGQD